MARARLDATLRRVGSRAIAPASRLFRGAAPSPSLPERDQRKLIEQLRACLEPLLGAAIARSRAAEVAEVYLTLDDVGRRRFFALLAEHCRPDRATVDVAVGHYAATAARPGRSADLAAAEADLRLALVPGWERLFRSFCGLDEGVKFAVDLRADLLRARREPETVDPDAALERLDRDLRGVLEAAFDVGLLELRRVTWATPASVLEKLIEYEAVHEITSWADLKNRLGADRRCYAFFHPGMPDEPLIFVEVALAHGMAAEIGPLLDLSAPVADAEAADTAVFYSISACQAGLAGVSLGDYLLKWVVADLQHDLPGLRRFATLSPIPGLRAWLERQLAEDPTGLVGLLGDDQRSRLAEQGGGDPEAALARLVQGPDWVEEDGVAAAVRPALLRLGAHYLVRETREGRARDRVANFHLTNGARVERLNWLGNPGPTGMAESLGLMVNYRYDPDRIEANHVDYVLRGRVPTSSTVSRLLG
ncbi:MAG: Malonyl-CoA decarboxylase [Acidimicrobiia bacterium]|nr:Malonyl-CoA decarboxylase [Acidimicrobiia bacterium]